MAESVDVHASGSWVGDTLEEFKKLPTWGKILAGLVILAVVAYAVHVYSNRNTANGSTLASSTGATTGGVAASNYPASSSAPIPYQPIYNAPSDSQAAITTPAATTPANPSLFSVLTRGLWPGETAQTTAGGVPIWKNPNANWSEDLGGIPLNSQIQVGQSVQGNYFGKLATYYPVSYQGQQGYILSSDLGNTPPVQSAPPPNSTPVGQGSSGDGRFHIVQYGENMGNVARAYGLKSWRDFGVDEFWHGQKVSIPS